MLLNLKTTFDSILNTTIETTKKGTVKVVDKLKVKGDFKELAYPWLLLTLLLVVLPILILIIYSFLDVTNGVVVGLTLGNYGQFFSSIAMLQVLATSVFIATLATFFCLLVGYPVAYLMAEITNQRNKTMIWALVTMPIWINLLIRVISLQLVINAIAPQLIGTHAAVQIGMVYAFVPFMILPLYDHLSNRNRDLEMAAQDLGATKWYTFRKITFPNSLNAVYAGCLLVLLPAMTGIVVVHYMSGGGITTIGTVLESLFISGSEYSYGAAVAIITTLTMIVLILILKVLTKQRIRKPKEERRRYKHG